MKLKMTETPKRKRETEIPDQNEVGRAIGCCSNLCQISCYQSQEYQYSCRLNSGWGAVGYRMFRKKNSITNRNGWHCIIVVCFQSAMQGLWKWQRSWTLSEDCVLAPFCSQFKIHLILSVLGVSVGSWWWPRLCFLCQLRALSTLWEALHLGRSSPEASILWSKLHLEAWVAWVSSPCKSSECH